MANELYPSFRNILSILIILFTSGGVYFTTTSTLDHSREFIRALNYHLLGHESFNIYWVGPDMINYPIKQFYQLPDLQECLMNMIDFFNNFDTFAHENINQTQFSQLQHTLYFQNRNGIISTHFWTFQEGIRQPFDVQDLQSIRSSFNTLETIKLQFHPISVSGHQWNILILIQPFAQSSIILQIIANQQISLITQHITTSILGIVLLFYLLINKFNYQLLPDYLLASMLLLCGMLSFIGIGCYVLLIIDGITCLISWLNILKVFSKEDDYHMSLLIRKSYILVGRLFVSFGPLFIAFGLFAYTSFCRYSGQFRSLHSTLMSLFYICYYNMTYESFVVTERVGPISTIFFFLFVILFTICIYGSMLVSVFCSYVWNKREKKIQKDIIQNLKIQCSSCNYKYKYIDQLRKSQLSHASDRNLSEIYDVHKPNQSLQYQEALLNRIHFLVVRTQKILSQTQHITHLIQTSQIARKIMIQQFQIQVNKIENLLKQPIY